MLNYIKMFQIFLIEKNIKIFTDKYILIDY